MGKGMSLEEFRTALSSDATIEKIERKFIYDLCWII